MMTNLKLARYTQEIVRLDAIIGAPGSNPGVIAFVAEKLRAARSALKKQDEDTAWFNLYGAATFCQSNRVQPEKALLAVSRINRLLA
jgi:hypothetical protein